MSRNKYKPKPGLRHTAKKDEVLWIHSMGKRFRVTAIFTDDDSANQWMENHRDQGLIAEFGPFRIVADLQDGRKEREND